MHISTNCCGSIDANSSHLARERPLLRAARRWIPKSPCRTWPVASAALASSTAARHAPPKARMSWCFCPNLLVMYADVCVNLYTIHMYNYVYISIYTNICIYIYIYICTYVHTSIHTYLPTFIHTCRQTDRQTDIHTCMHACMHAYIHTSNMDAPHRSWFINLPGQDTCAVCSSGYRLTADGKCENANMLYWCLAAGEIPMGDPTIQ